jgi:arginyl-tRNA synthetase
VRARRLLEKSTLKKEIINGVKSTHQLSLDETNLIKLLNDFNEILNETAKRNMPHILCKYSYQLTKAFNSFYNNVHILSEENNNTKDFRLKLVDLFSIILKESFTVLGIEMPEKM